MTRAAWLTVVVAVAGCGKGGGGPKPLLERALETQHQVIQDVELDIKIPAGLKPQPRGGTEVHWIATRDATLDIAIQVASPTAMQNALNAEDQSQRRVSRSEQTAEGWVVTSSTADGGTVHAQRMIEKDRRAVFCRTTLTVKTPGHDAKRTAWVEAICQSMVPTKL